MLETVIACTCIYDNMKSHVFTCHQGYITGMHFNKNELFNKICLISRYPSGNEEISYLLKYKKL